MGTGIRKLEPISLRYAAFLLALTLSWCCYAQDPATNRLASVFVRQPNQPVGVDRQLPEDRFRRRWLRRKPEAGRHDDMSARSCE